MDCLFIYDQKLNKEEKDYLKNYSFPCIHQTKPRRIEKYIDWNENSSKIVLFYVLLIWGKKTILTLALFFVNSSYSKSVYLCCPVLNLDVINL